MVKEINETQELNFKLIEKTSFNEFDGKKAVEKLKARQDLWEAVLIDRLNSLVKLRDLPQGHWNVDTLYILTKNTPCENNQLFNLIKELNPDEIGFMKNPGSILGDTATKHKVLVAWWD